MSGIPPWHLWGTDFSVDVTTDGLTSGTVASSQLSKVTYKRPESWGFLFSAHLSNFTSGGGAFNVDVFFDLMIGLGRTTIVIPGFEHYVFVLPGDVNKTLYSAEVQGPLRFAGDATPNLITEIHAEEINCSFRAVFGGVSAGAVTVTAGAAFSPKVHVRPEWFEQRFPGGETEGH